jgi:uncharacterized protein (DUF305 family)
MRMLASTAAVVAAVIWSGAGYAADANGAGQHQHMHGEAMHSDEPGAMMAAKSDGELAAMLIEHHQGAIRMAQREQAQGEDPKVKQLARDTARKQARELDQLQEIAQKYGAKPHMPEKMQQKQQQSEQMLQQAKGRDLDEQFLHQMIEHHQDGIAMVKASQPNLKDQKLRDLTQKMIKDQQEEIEKMQKMHQ